MQPTDRSTPQPVSGRLELRRQSARLAMACSPVPRAIVHPSSLSHRLPHPRRCQCSARTRGAAQRRCETSAQVADGRSGIRRRREPRQGRQAASAQRPAAPATSPRPPQRGRAHRDVIADLEGPRRRGGAGRALSGPPNGGSVGSSQPDSPNASVCGRSVRQRARARGGSCRPASGCWRCNRWRTGSRVRP